MADEVKETPAGEVSPPPTKKALPTTLIIMVAALVLVAAGGFFAGKIFSGKGGESKKDAKAQTVEKKAPAETKKEDKPANTEEKKATGEQNPASEEQKTDTTAAATADNKPIPEGKTGLLTLDEFTVNLNDPFGKRYAMMAINLEITTKELVTRIKEDQLLNAKIRDIIFMIISAKSYNELISVAGRFTLKEEIQMRVNEKIKETLNVEPIKDVLFTKYLLQ